MTRMNPIGGTIGVVGDLMSREGYSSRRHIPPVMRSGWPRSAKLVCALLVAALVAVGAWWRLA